MNIGAGKIMLGYRTSWHEVVQVGPFLRQ